MPLVNMTILYAACVVGAVGVFLALPRRGSRLALLGSIIAGGALGAAFLALVPRAVGAESGDVPGFMFYTMAFIATGGAIRMITHPRPVYAALYFILVVIATAGLFLLLAAEFMAFALVIVYAGAILVTYLFVIMLAHETPDEEDWSVLTEYDANAREPLAACIAGFVLLATLLGVGYRGLAPDAAPPTSSLAAIEREHEDLALMPMKVQRALADADLLPEGGTVVVVDPVGQSAMIELETGALQAVEIPDSLRVENVESIGLSLFNEFPVSLELAGVILFMAMLGAVVLARKPRSPSPAGSTAEALGEPG